MKPHSRNGKLTHVKENATGAATAPRAAGRGLKPRSRVDRDIEQLLFDDAQYAEENADIPAVDAGNGRTNRPSPRVAGRVPNTDQNPLGPEDDSDADESFLLDQPAGRQRPRDHRKLSNYDDPEDANVDEWYGSEAQRLIAQQGSEQFPGNRSVAVPRWVLNYFDDVERAVVFAQIVYWFGQTHGGGRRAGRRSGGRSVVDKTHQALADEIGLKNKRKIERHLKAFKADGLLDYCTIGYGTGKSTRIWLLPDGMRRAYSEGCQRIKDT